MKKPLLLIATIFNIFVSQSQVSWEKIYSGKTANTFTKTLSNKYILAGSTYESMMQRWMIFQADSLGNIKWDSTFIHGSDGRPECIEATKDSGYIIAGHDNYNPYFLKFDKNNRLEWESKINNEGGYSIFGILNIDNNNYMSVGGGMGSYSMETFIAKLNDKGDTLWTKTYKKLSSSVSIIQSFDNEYYCLTISGKLVKFTDNGDTLWTMPYTNINNFVATSMVRTPDSCIVIAGRDDIGNHAYFTKVDKNGKSIWTKNYVNNFPYGCNYISNTYDKGFITSNSTDNSFCVMKLDKNGDSVFTIHPPIKLKSEKIIQTTDSLFLFLANDMYNTPVLIKTDSIGKVITSIKKNSLSSGVLDCYPNPFDNELNIRFNKPHNTYADLNIYDILGVLVYTEKITATGNATITIKTGNLKRGIYFVKLNTDNQIFSAKLFKK